MTKFICFLLACFIAMTFVLVGCGPQKEESSQAAITAAKAMETAREKVDYLIGQAKAFYNSKDFQETIDITQYILRYLDRDSQAAKALLEKAKDALTSAAKGAVSDVRERMRF
ncbi:MAG: hypothetical protein JSW17_01165 [Candidatus Omnitrophota bacterium]|nr:MAG: hypothetical protein JSW17_01165 [Candidatus Omnitrophota bacterium]